MIDPGTDRLKNRQNLKMIDFVRVKEESPAQRKERIKEPPPKPKEPPKKPKIDTQTTMDQESKTPDIHAPDLDIPLDIGNTGLPGDALVGAGGGSATAELIPLVQMRPLYPRKAKMLKKEGVVTMEFTITESGLVRDIKVIKAEPPGFFEKSAVRALAKWKFKPKVENGQAVPQRATLDFEFSLEDQ